MVIRFGLSVDVKTFKLNMCLFKFVDLFFKAREERNAKPRAKGSTPAEN